MNSSMDDRSDIGEQDGSTGEARVEEAPARPRPAPLSWQLKATLGAVALAILVLLFWPHGKGTSAPGGFLLDGDGRPSPMGSRLAPVTLVHFWATWCPPCIQEIPALQRLARDFAGHDDFTVLMVAVSDSNNKVRNFLGRNADMVLFDPNWEVANRYGTDKLPETYLVVKGQVVRKFVGMTDWDDAALRREIQSKLKGGGPSTAALR